MQRSASAARLVHKCSQTLQTQWAGDASIRAAELVICMSGPSPVRMGQPPIFTSLLTHRSASVYYSLAPTGLNDRPHRSSRFSGWCTRGSSADVIGHLTAACRARVCARFSLGYGQYALQLVIPHVRRHDLNYNPFHGAHDLLSGAKLNRGSSRQCS